MNLMLKHAGPALHHKHAGLALDAKALTEDGEFEGYASTFGNVDNGGDIVMPGAFLGSLGKRPAAKVKMLRDHDMRRMCGVWLEAREDGRGLRVKGKLILDLQEGRETYALMKAGALDSLSIGYRTLGEEYERDRDGRRSIRKITKADLMEVSIVPFPMNEDAGIDTVRGASAFRTIREFEAFLRDEGGFSHTAARQIAERGFKSSDPRDEDDGDAGAIDALRTLARKFRGER